NEGGAPDVLADTTFVLNAPNDCVFTPVSPRTVPNKKLLLGLNGDVTPFWSVTCSAAGAHTFDVDVSAAIASPGLIDPDLTNNAGSGSVVVAIAP
ncbi:MAG TPA: hypothetical protein VFO59_02600, partial [Dehalococcoidia bacterium]|nr:hypothetical protein [Dehalococcoidia bacterium]